MVQNKAMIKIQTTKDIIDNTIVNFEVCGLEFRISKARTIPRRGMNIAMIPENMKPKKPSCVFI